MVGALLLYSNKDNPLKDWRKLSASQAMCSATVKPTSSAL